MAQEPRPIGEETYEPGKPAGPYNWRAKLTSRGKMLRYLQTGERYWFGKEWYGSEKRRAPA
ncbi:MAG: hypothetical protein AB1505_10965 [Candidatus Latescibacterota bacterium]